MTHPLFLMLRPWPHQGFYFSEEPHPGKRQQQTKLNGRSTRALGYFKLKELLLLFFLMDVTKETIRCMLRDAVRKLRGMTRTASKKKTTTTTTKREYKKCR